MSSADDLDLALVADDLSGALDPERSQALHERLAADPAVAGRYAEFARMLEGVSALLAAELSPPVPDDIVRRLDAALAREVDTVTAQEKALARLKPAGHRSLLGRSVRSRSLRGWTAGLVGVAALSGVVAVVVHGGGGASSASSSSAGASRVSSGSGAGLAAAPERVPSAAAAASDSTSTEMAKPMPSPAASSGSVVVTATNLASVVRAVHPFAGSVPTPASGVSKTPRPLARLGDSGVPASCRPAGVPGAVPLLAAEPVRFDGRPAVLLVLAEPTDPIGTVRATVVAACGGPALLTHEVTPAG